MQSTLTTLQKAQHMNLDAKRYGTFAEIGAGQEVANWFFRASGTAGTTAKSISAYDMTMSDAIYGKAERYVSRDRLQSMLNYEYQLLENRLGKKRGAHTAFFSFANTVKARGWKDQGECHGWMGITYQLTPQTSPCEILLHLRLLDQRNISQMEALGILGVNLIYAAFYLHHDLEAFTKSLLDGLSTSRIEIDLLKFSGESFAQRDNRLSQLQLVTSGLTEAAMFLPGGEVIQPAEALYNRPLIVLRGSFHPITKLHLDMLEQAQHLFKEKYPDSALQDIVEICEISTNNLLRQSSSHSSINSQELLLRADALQALGKTVLFSRWAEFHRMSSYLGRYTTRPTGLVLSIGLLHELFKEKWSKKLKGGILESFGKLFIDGVSLCVYPWKNRKTGELVTANNFLVPKHLSALYTFFRQNNLIDALDCSNPKLLDYTSRDVLRMQEEGDQRFQELLP